MHITPYYFDLRTTIATYYFMKIGLVDLSTHGGKIFYGFCSVKTLKTEEFVNFNRVFACNLKKTQNVEFEHFCNKKTLK